MHDLTKNHYNAIISYYKQGTKMNNKQDLAELISHMRYYINSLHFIHLPEWVKDEVFASYSAINKSYQCYR